MHDCRQELETTNKNTPAHAAALQFRVNGAEPRYSAPIFFGRIRRAAVGCDWVGRGGTCSSLTDWMWLSCSSGATESDVCLTLAASSQNVKFPVCQKKKAEAVSEYRGPNTENCFDRFDPTRADIQSCCTPPRQCATRHNVHAAARGTGDITPSTPP